MRLTTVDTRGASWACATADAYSATPAVTPIQTPRRTFDRKGAIVTDGGGRILTVTYRLGMLGDSMHTTELVLDS